MINFYYLVCFFSGLLFSYSNPPQPNNDKDEYGWISKHTPDDNVNIRNGYQLKGVPPFDKSRTDSETLLNDRMEGKGKDSQIPSRPGLKFGHQLKPEDIDWKVARHLHSQARHLHSQNSKEDQKSPKIINSATNTPQKSGVQSIKIFFNGDQMRTCTNSMETLSRYIKVEDIEDINGNYSVEAVTANFLYFAIIHHQQTPNRSITSPAILELAIRLAYSSAISYKMKKSNLIDYNRDKIKKCNCRLDPSSRDVYTDGAFVYDSVGRGYHLLRIDQKEPLSTLPNPAVELVIRLNALKAKEHPSLSDLFPKMKSLIYEYHEQNLDTDSQTPHLRYPYQSSDQSFDPAALSMIYSTYFLLNTIEELGIQFDQRVYNLMEKRSDPWFTLNKDENQTKGANKIISMFNATHLWDSTHTYPLCNTLRCIHRKFWLQNTVIQRIIEPKFILGAGIDESFGFVSIENYNEVNWSNHFFLDHLKNRAFVLLLGKHIEGASIYKNPNFPEQLDGLVYIRENFDLDVYGVPGVEKKLFSSRSLPIRMNYISTGLRWNMPNNYYQILYNRRDWDSSTIIDLSIVNIDTWALIVKVPFDDYLPEMNEQMTWIRNTLLDSALRVRFTVVMGHHCIVNPNGVADSHFSTQLLELFEKFDVTQYICTDPAGRSATYGSVQQVAVNKESQASMNKMSGMKRLYRYLNEGFSMLFKSCLPRRKAKEPTPAVGATHRVTEEFFETSVFCTHKTFSWKQTIRSNASNRIVVLENIHKFDAEIRDLLCLHTPTLQINRYLFDLRREIKNAYEKENKIVNISETFDTQKSMMASEYLDDIWKPLRHLRISTYLSDNYITSTRLYNDNFGARQDNVMPKVLTSEHLEFLYKPNDSNLDSFLWYFNGASKESLLADYKNSDFSVLLNFLLMIRHCLYRTLVSLLPTQNRGGVMWQSSISQPDSDNTEYLLKGLKNTTQSQIGLKSAYPQHILDTIWLLKRHEDLCDKEMENAPTVYESLISPIPSFKLKSPFPNSLNSHPTKPNRGDNEQTKPENKDVNPAEKKTGYFGGMKKRVKLFFKRFNAKDPKKKAIFPSDTTTVEIVTEYEGPEAKQGVGDDKDRQEDGDETEATTVTDKFNQTNSPDDCSYISLNMNDDSDSESSSSEDNKQ